MNCGGDGIGIIHQMPHILHNIVVVGEVMALSKSRPNMCKHAGNHESLVPKVQPFVHCCLPQLLARQPPFAPERKILGGVTYSDGGCRLVALVWQTAGKAIYQPLVPTSVHSLTDCGCHIHQDRTLQFLFSFGLFLRFPLFTAVFAAAAAAAALAFALVAPFSFAAASLASQRSLSSLS